MHWNSSPRHRGVIWPGYPVAVRQTNVSVNVLVISSSQQDHEWSCRALREPDWSVRCLRNPQEARSALQAWDVDIVVLADCESADAPGWYEVLGEIEDMLGFQPVIVTSRAADGRLWQEVLTSACPDLVPQALYLKQVLHAPAMAGADGAVAAAQRQHGGARPRLQRRGQPRAGQRSEA